MRFSMILCLMYFLPVFCVGPRPANAQNFGSTVEMLEQKVNEDINRIRIDQNLERQAADAQIAAYKTALELFMRAFSPEIISAINAQQTTFYSADHALYYALQKLDADQNNPNSSPNVWFSKFARLDRLIDELGELVRISNPVSRTLEVNYVLTQLGFNNDGTRSSDAEQTVEALAALFDAARATKAYLAHDSNWQNKKEQLLSKAPAGSMGAKLHGVFAQLVRWRASYEAYVKSVSDATNSILDKYSDRDARDTEQRTIHMRRDRSYITEAFENLTAFRDLNPDTRKQLLNIVSQLSAQLKRELIAILRPEEYTNARAMPELLKCIGMFAESK